MGHFAIFKMIKRIPKSEAIIWVSSDTRLTKLGGNPWVSSDTRLTKYGEHL